MRVLREPWSNTTFNEVNAHIYFITDSLYTTVEKSLKIHVKTGFVFQIENVMIKMNSSVFFLIQIWSMHELYHEIERANKMRKQR